MTEVSRGVRTCGRSKCAFTSIQTLIIENFALFALKKKRKSRRYIKRVVFLYSPLSAVLSSISVTLLLISLTSSEYAS